MRKLALVFVSQEIWPVALIVAASWMMTRLLLVAILVAVLFWLVRWVALGRISVRTPADWAILLLATMALVTLWATPLPEKTRPQVYRLLTGIAMYYAIANWAITKTRLRMLLAGIVAVGLGLVLIAAVGVEWPSTVKLPFVPESLYAHLPLLLSDTIHPNVMAGSLVIILPVILALISFGWSQMSRLVQTSLSLITLSMLGILLLTKSRGAWMALAAVLVTIALLRYRWGWLALLVICISVAGAAILLGPSELLEIVTANDTIGGIRGRLEIWTRAIYMIRDFPFTGIGMGLYGDIADILYPFFLLAPGSVPHSHNLFFQVAVDTGLPGLVAWFAILTLVTIISWQVYRHNNRTGDSIAAGLGAGLLCSNLALGVHGLTDAVTWGMVRPAPLVWVIWGLAIAASNVYNSGVPGERFETGVQAMDPSASALS